MARYQYRFSGPLDWASSSGNALFVISNPIGSGKKLTLSQLEIDPTLWTLNAALNANSFGPIVVFSWIYRGDDLAGEEAPTPVAHDKNAPAWPSSVKVFKEGPAVGVSAAIRRVSMFKRDITVASGIYENLARQDTIGLADFKGFNLNRNKDTTLEPVRAASNFDDILGLYCTNLQQGMQVRCDATFVVWDSEDTGNRWTYSTSFFTTIKSPAQTICCVHTMLDAWITVEVKDIRLTEVGGRTTPYFQLVPAGPVADVNNVASVPLLKMDTNHPDPSSWIKMYSNAAILPITGVEDTISPASTSAPKGFNYLKTKDFLGPVYRTFFPEVARTPNSALAEHFVWNSQKMSDIFLRRAGITIREGESIALVTSAETANSGLVDVSGHMAFEFGGMITVEPSIEPTLTITGLKNPSEVRIFSAGTGTLLAGQENVTSGTFQWLYDPDLVSSVDIAVLSLGYQNSRLTNFPLTGTDVLIPMQQQIDRQYNNP